MTKPMGLTDLEGKLLAAARLALNFISNTESELGISMSSGDALREAIANAEACSFRCCRGLAPEEECGCHKSSIEGLALCFKEGLADV
jgi:hypothetical protein